MKATVYSVEGKALKEIDLPSQFWAAARDDLVKRAVLSEESKMYQPKGSYKWAGLETSAKYRGRKEDYAA
ncbi:TPA: 50S ribosomal protein L4, partial [Candidatus Micrarchaeota archaeon]|nr:50S ribosomal protein L4 [Candidatus Micrarchaeota archaeon]